MGHKPPYPKSSPVPTKRRVAFEFPDDLQAAWNPSNREFSYAANAVSLLMPYAEPYFVRSALDAVPDLDPALAERTRAYAHQEAQHHRQHRHFNDLLVARQPSLARAETWMQATYGWLGRTRSAPFNLAFAAASETIAFSLARWSMLHLSSFFDGAEPVAATVFLWHLAEEVEHKSVAFDVWEAVDGSRLRYSLAMFTTFSILGWFAVMTILMMLWHDKSFRHPTTYVRLTVLLFSFLWQCLPDLAASALPGHHPTHFTDPPLLSTWIQTYDPVTKTMPLWGLDATPRS